MKVWVCKFCVRISCVEGTWRCPRHIGYLVQAELDELRKKRREHPDFCLWAAKGMLPGGVDVRCKDDSA